MENRIIVEAMHRLEIVRRMRIQILMRQTDVHSGQGPILRYIKANPKCTQVEIAEALGVSPPSITCSVRRMENAGLIVKTADQNDMRCTRLELTPKGAENHLKVYELLGELDAEMFGGISEAEKEQFKRLLDKMTVNLYKDSMNRPLPELANELQKMEDDEKGC